jgi:tRNA C32,U32 (ribose-2'-O)-methylase TrmJ
MSEIKCKQVGQNLTIVVAGKTYSKRFDDKEKREAMKNKILLENKKPSESRRNQILKAFDKTIEEKEVKVAKKKGLKKAIEKIKKAVTKTKKVDTTTLIETVEEEYEKGSFTEQEIDYLQEVLRKKKEKLLSEQKAVQTATPRRGEH